MTVSLTLAGACVALLASGVIWTAAANLCRGALALQAPVCPECGAPLPGTAWLPSAGFTVPTACRTCEWTDAAVRWRFEVFWAFYCVVAALRFEQWSRFFEVLIFGAILALIALVDVRCGLVYIGTLALGMAAATVFAIAGGKEQVAGAAGGALIGMLVVGCFLVIGRIFSGGRAASPVQSTDLYLAAVIGAMTRLEAVLLALFIAVLLGIGALAVQRWRSPATPARLTQFGPLLSLGAMLALVIRA